jgi:hypothetical protein
MHYHLAFVDSGGGFDEKEDGFLDEFRSWEEGKMWIWPFSLSFSSSGFQEVFPEKGGWIVPVHVFAR